MLSCGPHPGQVPLSRLPADARSAWEPQPHASKNTDPKQKLRTPNNPKQPHTHKTSIIEGNPKHLHRWGQVLPRECAGILAVRPAPPPWTAGEGARRGGSTSALEDPCGGPLPEETTFSEYFTWPRCTKARVVLKMFSREARGHPLHKDSITRSNKNSMEGMRHRRKAPQPD